jgi:hypothetical protein
MSNIDPNVQLMLGGMSGLGGAMHEHAQKKAPLTGMQKYLAAVMAGEMSPKEAAIRAKLEGGGGGGFSPQVDYDPGSAPSRPPEPQHMPAPKALQQGLGSVLPQQYAQPQAQGLGALAPEPEPYPSSMSVRTARPMADMQPAGLASMQGPPIPQNQEEYQQLVAAYAARPKGLSLEDRLRIKKEDAERMLMLQLLKGNQAKENIGARGEVKGKLLDDSQEHDKEMHGLKAGEKEKDRTATQKRTDTMAGAGVQRAKIGATSRETVAKEKAAKAGSSADPVIKDITTRLGNLNSALARIAASGMQGSTVKAELEALRAQREGVLEEKRSYLSSQGFQIWRTKDGAEIAADSEATAKANGGVSRIR